MTWIDVATIRRTPLRDYLLRLGAVAEIANDGCLRVTQLPADEDLAGWLRSWTEVNGVFARIVARGESAPSDESPARRENEPPPRLGELLISKGWITREQLQDALAESRHGGDLLGRVLLRRGLIYEEELARTLADQWSIPYVSLMRIGVNPAVVRLLPREVGLRFAAIPVRFHRSTVQVAFADPSDRGALEAVQEHLGSVTSAVAELSDIEMMWRGSRLTGAA